MMTMFLSTLMALILCEVLFAKNNVKDVERTQVFGAQLLSTALWCTIMGAIVFLPYLFKSEELKEMFAGFGGEVGIALTTTLVIQVANLLMVATLKVLSRIFPSHFVTFNADERTVMNYLAAVAGCMLAIKMDMMIAAITMAITLIGKPALVFATKYLSAVIMSEEKPSLSWSKVSAFTIETMVIVVSVCGAALNDVNVIVYVIAITAALLCFALITYYNVVGLIAMMLTNIISSIKSLGRRKKKMTSKTKRH